jgi:hypothetical protein
LNLKITLPRSLYRRNQAIAEVYALGSPELGLMNAIEIYQLEVLVYGVNAVCTAFSRQGSTSIVSPLWSFASLPF